MTQNQVIEELGSGVNNVTKYLPFYAPGPGTPAFIEDDMFTTVVPLAPTAGEVTGEVGQLLRVLTSPMTRSKIQAVLTLKGQANFRVCYLQPALNAGLVEMTIPDKPKSRLQKYRLTEKGRRVSSQSEKGQLK